MNLSHNTVLITGGTSGIGQALAAQFLACGNTVLVTGRSEARLAGVRRALSGVHTFVCDQADPISITRLCAEVTAAFPNLNVLINNAGIGLKLNLNDESRSLADLEAEIRTNLIGPIQMIQLLLPHLKRQPASVIVNVSSGLAFVPMPLKPIYCATKAAIHSYTQSLRVQLKTSPVRVVELVPPAVRTEFNAGQEEINVKGAMDVTAFAEATMRGLGAGRDEILPGLAPVLRLIGRLNPHALVRKAEAERMGA
jgi:uncharacterized oxidoreductase